VALHRGIDGSDPVGAGPISRTTAAQQEIRAARSWLLATGTLACPGCDAPVAPGPSALSPVEPLECPYCSRSGPVRDFLSLAAPSRPARVQVRVVAPDLARR
jgi:hypothetical protein